MERDWVYRAAWWVNYPWIARIDRSIYQGYPQLDPVRLLRHCFYAALGGYAVARVAGWNRLWCSAGLVLPLLVKFLADEWRLSSELPPPGLIDFRKTPKLQLPSPPVSDSSSTPFPASSAPSRFTSLRELPFLEHKVLQADDLLAQLPSDYFK
jgi:hypothetical protein